MRLTLSLKRVTGWEKMLSSYSWLKLNSVVKIQCPESACPKKSPFGIGESPLFWSALTCASAVAAPPFCATAKAHVTQNANSNIVSLLMSVLKSSGDDDRVP